MTPRDSVSRRSSASSIDGVLLVDKPAGPTSHDVVQRVRRALGQSGVGHTGTLDPSATGLLPLVLGKATKIASLLSGSDKTYDATIRFGFATDTDDAEGAPLGDPSKLLPSDDEISKALDRFRGAFEQLPPNHSAKRVAGARAYELARKAKPVALKLVIVTVRRLEWLGRNDDVLHVRVSAGAGFYVRALARDLGAHLGCGGHLSRLRRIQSGSFDIQQAVTLDEVERLGPDVAVRVISASAALPQLSAVEVDEIGLRRALHGNPLGPQHVRGQGVTGLDATEPVKVLDAEGRLIALARARGGALHPIVVLG